MPLQPTRPLNPDTLVWGPHSHPNRSDCVSKCLMGRFQEHPYLMEPSQQPILQMRKLNLREMKFK